MIAGLLPLTELEKIRPFSSFPRDENGSIWSVRKSSNRFCQHNLVEGLTLETTAFKFLTAVKLVDKSKFLYLT